MAPCLDSQHTRPREILGARHVMLSYSTGSWRTIVVTKVPKTIFFLISAPRVAAGPRFRVWEPPARSPGPDAPTRTWLSSGARQAFARGAAGGLSASCGSVPRPGVRVAVRSTWPARRRVAPLSRSPPPRVSAARRPSRPAGTAFRRGAAVAGRSPLPQYEGQPAGSRGTRPIAGRGGWRQPLR